MILFVWRRLLPWLGYVLAIMKVPVKEKMADFLYEAIHSKQYWSKMFGQWCFTLLCPVKWDKGMTFTAIVIVEIVLILQANTQFREIFFQHVLAAIRKIAVRIYWAGKRTLQTHFPRFLNKIPKLAWCIWALVPAVAHCFCGTKVPLPSKGGKL